MGVALPSRIFVHTTRSVVTSSKSLSSYVSRVSHSPQYSIEMIERERTDPMK